MPSATLGYLAVLREHLSASPVVLLGVFVLLAAALVAAILGSRLAALVLVPLAVIWLVVNRQVEGATLVVLSTRHGITVADLLSIVAFGVASWRLVPVVTGCLTRSGR
jgi:hypothetical protein